MADRAPIMVWLCNHCTDIAAASVDSAEFSVGDCGPVHDDGGDSPHAVVALAAGFALNEPGKKFSCIQWHTLPPVFPGTDLFYAGASADVHKKRSRG